MVIKYGKLMTLLDRFPPKNSHNPLSIHESHVINEKDISTITILMATILISIVT